MTSAANVTGASPSFLHAGLTRRGLLSAAGLGVAGALLPTGFAGAAATTPQWPGHKPGRIYLGMSCAEGIATAEAQTGRVGVRRSFFGWDDAKSEDTRIRDDHAKGRLPWVSFKPPGGSAAGWAAVAAGSYDSELKARATRYAGLGKPIIATFHHEPTNDSEDGATFAAAWVRMYDVMKAQTGLKNVAFAPIIGEWEFNPRNKTGHPQDYLPPAVLKRMAFLGIDCYQNAGGQSFDTRLGYILRWLAARGHSNEMIGIGETGCTDAFDTPGAVEWWNASWAWAKDHADNIGVISYFNSGRNSKANVHWPLDESPAKLAAYRSALKSSSACRL